MSKCPEELRGLLASFGIDPESVEVHAVDARNCPVNLLDELASEAKRKAKTVSDDLGAAYMRSLGISNEEIKEIIERAEENRKKKAEAEKAEELQKKLVSNNVVEMTLKSIAKAYGYTLGNAVLINGIPVVDEIERIGESIGKLEPKVRFSVNCGCFVVVPSPEIVEPENAETYMQALSNAINMCKALNQIDCRTWPSIN